jgi:hypothetical protein
MAATKTSLCFAFAIAFAGVAAAVPTPRNNAVSSGTLKSEPQLDRAALFRPIRSGECGTLVRRVKIAARNSQQQRHAPRQQSLANSGCSVVWSD